MAGRVLSVVCLLCMAGWALSDDVCREFPGDSDALPNVRAREFTVDVEMSKQPSGRVGQIKLVYSSRKNQIRMTILENGKKKDIFYIANEADGEVIKIDYSGPGRGKCQVSTFAEEKNKAMFYVGGSKRSSIQLPLEFLHLTGRSGFGDNQIVLKKRDDTTIRDIPAERYESCQALKDGTDTDMKFLVQHYFDKANNGIPLAIKVKGSGTYMRRQSDDFKHTYSFFNYRESVNPVDLQTPEGVYCERRAPFNFVPIPENIKLTAEVVDKMAGTISYIDQIFDANNKFSFHRKDGQTIFRAYDSGLSFQILDEVMSCTVQNITQSAVLAFDYRNAKGNVEQFSKEQFFYSTEYQFIGERLYRGMTADVYVGKANLHNRGADLATIEWYFAKHGIKSWNDELPEFQSKGLRMPLAMRVWRNELDAVDESIDSHFFNVDFSDMMFGKVDLRPCFTDERTNHFQIIIDGNKNDVIQNNLEIFKWKTMLVLSEYTMIQWWRFADFQVYFKTDKVVVEFEVLPKPPMASDLPVPAIYLTVSQAHDNLKNKLAADGTLSIAAYDATKRDFSRVLKAKLGDISV